MICESCNVSQATMHVTRNINGALSEYHLCPDCAQKLGMDGLFTGFSFGLDNLIGSVMGGHFGEISGKAPETRCDRCGVSFEDIVRSGRVGCADCYQKFYDKLLPSIQRMHGNTHHIGKIPAQQSAASARQRELDALKQQLSEAIARQEFERAAQLRDQIRQMEGQV